MDGLSFSMGCCDPRSYGFLSVAFFINEIDLAFQFEVSQKYNKENLCF